MKNDGCSIIHTVVKVELCFLGSPKKKTNYMTSYEGGFAKCLQRTFVACNVLRSLRSKCKYIHFTKTFCYIRKEKKQF